MAQTTVKTTKTKKQDKEFNLPNPEDKQKMLEQITEQEIISLQRDLLLVNTSLQLGYGTPDLKAKYPEFMKSVYSRMHKNK